MLKVEHQYVDDPVSIIVSASYYSWTTYLRIQVYEDYDPYKLIHHLLKTIIADRKTTEAWRYHA